jgi:hypothetical protein
MEVKISLYKRISLVFNHTLLGAHSTKFCGWAQFDFEIDTRVG